jgi:hypothetical protein
VLVFLQKSSPAPADPKKRDIEVCFYFKLPVYDFDGV